MLNSLVAATFDTTPRLNIVPDAEIEMPSLEELWNASTNEQWQTLVVAGASGKSVSVLECLHQVVLKSHETTSDSNICDWSAFATAIVIHALNVHIWHLRQCTHGLVRLESASPTMKEILDRQIEMTLARVKHLFQGGDSDQEQNLQEPGASRRTNGFALLRIAYAKHATTSRPLTRMILFSSNGEQMLQEIRTYIKNGQAHGPLVTQTASMALDGIITAVKAGPILAMKTACLTWSIDHAIADWECGMVTRFLMT